MYFISNVAIHLQHVPICFFLLFLDAPMPGKTEGQILLSLKSLVLAHLI